MERLVGRLQRYIQDSPILTVAWIGVALGCYYSYGAASQWALSKWPSTITFIIESVIFVGALIVALWLGLRRKEGLDRFRILLFGYILLGIVWSYGNKSFPPGKRLVPTLGAIILLQLVPSPSREWNMFTRAVTIIVAGWIIAALYFPWTLPQLFH